MHLEFDSCEIASEFLSPKVVYTRFPILFSNLAVDDMTPAGVQLASLFYNIHGVGRARNARRRFIACIRIIRDDSIQSVRKQKDKIILHEQEWITKHELAKRVVTLLDWWVPAEHRKHSVFLR